MPTATWGGGWSTTAIGFLCLLVCVPAPGQDRINAQLPWHAAVLDPQGKLLAWYKPEENRGYDHVLRLGWDFIEHKVPVDQRTGTSLEIYLINPVFDGKTLQGTYWQHNPAMVFGSFVDSLVAWYPYSGDEEAPRAVRGMLDHMLTHGTTPGDWNWASVPFPTSCEGQADYGHCIQDMPHDFYGGVETDKVGELGIGYALFYEMTGERKYLEEAIHCANALASHVRSGDEDHTPWPFRVYAKTGEALDGEQYGGIVVSPLRLFDELIRLKEGDTASYRKAAETARTWLVSHPLNSDSKAWDKWSGYFEDVGKNTENVNQAAPTYTAYYLLSRPNLDEVDPRWSIHVGHLIDWVRGRFGRGPFFGAWAIDEQATPDGRGCCSRSGLGSDTSRWAAINALYFEKTGDGQAREDAFRSLNYATYFADSEGKISCCGEASSDGQYWFSDGYSDYLRHFNWVMGAIPELAPAGESHLLRSSSVVQRVQYIEHTIRYRTFDSAATDVLRLSFKPGSIRAGGIALTERTDLAEEGFTVRSLARGDFVVRVRHLHSGEVSISEK